MSLCAPLGCRISKIVFQGAYHSVASISKLKLTEFQLAILPYNSHTSSLKV
jgi:hypothetical protein